MLNDLKNSPRAEGSSEHPAPIQGIFALVFDVLCAFALFLFACLAAGFLDDIFPSAYPRLYILWFAIGMVPFIGFVHWRLALTFSWHSVAPLVLLILILPFVPMEIFGGADWIFLPVVLICLLSLGHRILALFASGDSRPKSDLK